MVAARIQGLAFASHGTSATPVPTTASSQGGLMSAMDAIQPLRCGTSSGVEMKGFLVPLDRIPLPFPACQSTSEELYS